MDVSPNCISLIKQFEGFRSKPYLCPAGIPTIGYGSTHYPNGTAVTLGDGEIDEATATAYILATLSLDYVPAVNAMVQVDLNQNQFDALVDFAYNAGTQNLRSSTLVRLVNAEAFEAAAGQFGLWVHAAGVVLQGLVNRREAERILFTS
jgi:lysozyme